MLRLGVFVACVFVNFEASTAEASAGSASKKIRAEAKAVLVASDGQSQQLGLARAESPGKTDADVAAQCVDDPALTPPGGCAAALQERLGAGLDRAYLCAPGGPGCTACCATCGAEHCVAPPPPGKHPDCQGDAWGQLCSPEQIFPRSLVNFPDPEGGADALTCTSVTEASAELPGGLSGCSTCCSTCAQLGADCTGIAPITSAQVTGIVEDFVADLRRAQADAAVAEKQKAIEARRKVDPRGRLDKCALICHLPEPIHHWRGVLEEKCDPDTSLYLNTDQVMNDYIVPLHGRALGWNDLAGAWSLTKRDCAAGGPHVDALLTALMRAVDGQLSVAALGDSAGWELRALANAKYKEITGLFLGVEGGAVVPPGALDGLEPCACADALEVMVVAQNHRSDPRCKEWPAAACDDAAPRILAALEALQRGPGGFRDNLFQEAAALLRKAGGPRGDALLPPPQQGCQTDRECWDSRFVGAGSRGPGGGTGILTVAQVSASQYSHAFERVVFATCPDVAIMDPDVQAVALALAAPDAVVTLWGNDLKTLQDKYCTAKDRAGPRSCRQQLLGRDLLDLDAEERVRSYTGAHKMGLTDLRLRGGALLELA